MSENIDKELLLTLATEIKDYLPKIIDNLELYKKDYNNVEALRDAHRHMHTIKGASSMVGLADLSHLAYYLEDSFEEILLGYKEMPPKLLVLVYDAATLIDTYLEKLLSKSEVDGKQVFGKITEEVKSFNEELKKESEGLTKRRASIYEEEVFGQTGEFAQVSQEDNDGLDFTETFLPEGQEYWEAICQNVTNLASNLDDKALLEKVRRPAHALKGAAGMVGFQTIYQICLQMQKLLENLQERENSPTPEVVALLFSCTNVIKSLLDTKKKDDPILTEQYRIKYQTLFQKLESFQAPVISPPQTIVETQRVSNVSGISTSSQTQEIDDISEELIDAFVDEGREHWQNISQALAGLVVRPSDVELLQEVRRHVHTLKGAANVVGFHTIGKLTHRMEDLLDYLHENSITPTIKMINLIYASSDAIEGFLTDRQHSDLTSLEGLFSEYKEMFSNLVMANSEAVSNVEWVTPAFPQLQEVQETQSSSFTSLSPTASFQQDIMLETFIAEAQEYWQNIFQNIPKLGKQPDNKDIIQEIRRSVHSLKGASGLVNFNTIRELTDSMEELLDKLCEFGIVPGPEIIELLFVSADSIEDLLGSREKSNLESLEGLLKQYKTLISNFDSQEIDQNLQKSQQVKEELLTIADLVKAQSAISFPKETEQKIEPSLERRRNDRREGGFVRIPIEKLDEIIKLIGELVINRSSFEQHFGNLIHHSDELEFSINRLKRISGRLESEYDVVALGGKIFTGKAIKADQPFFLPSGFSKTTTSSAYDFDELEFDRYTEFNVSLKELVETSTDMNTVSGELRNTIGDFDSYLNRLGRLTREAQDKLMQLRMVPLATLASRLHRTVRTTANQQQKQVDLILEGEHVELDKTVLEEIVDPLFHLLRNAVDHGIEPPALRQALGKAEKGEIKLQAYYEGTQVVIKITDDGSGINTSLVRSVAINRGFLSESDAEKVSDEQLFSFIFMPGFSTAKEVSEISGRGVGMDVVKAKVQKMKGTVGVTSVAGQGTTFVIQLPMTLAITRVLLIKVGKDTFAIPLGIVSQIFRIETSDIQLLGNRRVVKVQNQIYPLIWLADLLDLKQQNEDFEKFPVLIINLGERKIALVVDQLLEQREVVIKNLGNHLRRLQGIIGATLMGDGSVVLILNLLELLQQLVKAQSKQQVTAQGYQQTSRKEQKQLIKEQTPQVFEMPFISTPVEIVEEKVENLPATEIVEPPTLVSETKTKKDSLTVLIVDDSLSVRTVISNLIKKTGWIAVTAKDGLDALQVLQQAVELPDIVLVDIEMPRMDGYELTSSIRNQENYKHLPIIMLTSRAGGKHRQRAMDIGVNEYLIKPYQDEVLLNTIRRLTNLDS